MQKPSRGVGGKRFPDGFSDAAAAMVKRPADLKTRHAWKQLDYQGRRCGCRAWAWQSATASRTARRGDHGHARLEAAHGDDLLLLPDLEGEGAWSSAEDGVGAVIERVDRGTTPPHQTQTRRALSRSVGS